MNSALVVTWNVLATAYVRKSFYPHTPARCLDPTWRNAEIVKRAVALDADVLCLQEVDAEVFAMLRAKLAGHWSEHACKTNKPEGGATFVRHGIRIQKSERIAYRDGLESDSGHVGHVVEIESGGARVTIVNTHFKWGEGGWRMAEARAACDLVRDAPAAILCGDLNVTTDSDVIRLLDENGFVDAHRAFEAPTCNSNGVAKRIDYVLVRGALRATARLPRAIDALTPMPFDDEPSDHLPLAAVIEST